MFRNLIIAFVTILAACDTAPPTPGETVYVTNEGDVTINVTEIIVTEPFDGGDDQDNETDTDIDSDSDTQELEVDPCDVTLMAEADNGSIIDLNLGAAPLGLILHHTEVISEADAQHTGGRLSVSSFRGCGAFDLVGAQAQVASADGNTMYRTFEDVATIREIGGGSHSRYNEWYGVNGSPLANGTFVAWDAEWNGQFTATTIGPNDVVEFSTTLGFMKELPPGRYRVRYLLHWRDAETGTEFRAYAGVNDMDTFVTITDDPCYSDIRAENVTEHGIVKTLGAPAFQVASDSPNAGQPRGWTEVARFNVNSSYCVPETPIESVQIEVMTTDFEETGWNDDVHILIYDQDDRLLYDGPVLEDIPLDNLTVSSSNPLDQLRVEVETWEAAQYDALTVVLHSVTYTDGMGRRIFRGKHTSIGSMGLYGHAVYVNN